MSAPARQRKRLVFAGTPAFAAAALAALMAAGHEIVLVLTQPDRPAGRGLKLIESDVKRLAAAHALPVFQPATLRDDQSLKRLQATSADAMVVAAYGLILPQAVLDLFPLGCINIHASLLPRWRGAAPIQRALLAGDCRTGISIMRMEAGLDTGPVYLAQDLPIGPRDTAGALHVALADLGGRLIVAALDGISDGLLNPVAQPETGVTYAAKITREEALLDWRRSAADLDRSVRAFNPVPGAYTFMGADTVKVWSAEPVSATGLAPGELAADAGHGIVAGCGAGALRLIELQKAGGRRMSAAAFFRGRALGSGLRFGA